MQRTMPAFHGLLRWWHGHQFRAARDALMQKQLLAFKPWSQNDPDGVYQLWLCPPNDKTHPTIFKPCLPTCSSRFL
jgi:hypothetical protein